MAPFVTIYWGHDSQIVSYIMYASFHSSFLKVVRDFALYLTTWSLQKKKKHSLVFCVS